MTTRPIMFAAASAATLSLMVPRAVRAARAKPGPRPNRITLLALFSLFVTANPAATQSLPVPVVDSCPSVPQAAAATYMAQTFLYETTEDGQAQQLDLYTPFGVADPPLAMVIHGGGFINGDKATPDMLMLARQLVRLGWTVASINYRMSGANGFANYFPAALQDALCALQWIKTNGNGDANHVIVAGVSAGGGIANWIGTLGRQSNPAWHSPTCSSSPATAHVAGIASFYAFSDFADPAVYPGAGSLASWDERIFGFTISTRQATLVADSPVYAIDKAEPPYFVAGGLADTVILPAQVANYAAALQAAEIPTNLLQVAGLGHNFRPMGGVAVIRCTFVSWLSAVRSQ